MTVPPPPTAERRPIVRSHHGDDFVDDYEWLRDKEDPATLAYLEAENAYTDATTAHLEPLRQQIFDEIKARTLETDLSVPVRRGAWWYYARTVEGQQYAIRCRCPIDDADDWHPPLLEAGSRDRRRGGPARLQRRGRGPRVLLARRVQHQR